MEAIETPEEGRRISINGERVQQSRASEECVVGSGNNRGHDYSVDKAARDGTASFLEDNSEWTGASVAF